MPPNLPELKPLVSATNQQDGEGAITIEQVIQKESIGSEPIKPASTPAKAGEKLVTKGTSGGDRIVLFSLTGDGGTTLKYKLVHNLKTFAFAITYQKSESSKPGEPMASPIEKCVPINENEVELTFAATKPAAGETIWVRVEG